MEPAVVLLAKGGYGDWPSDELDRTVAVVRAAGAYTPVVGAYVDHGTPTLPAALDACAAAGASRILVAPTFTPMDRFLSVWLPQILRRWLRRRPPYRGVEIVYAPAIGTRDALGHAVLETLAEAATGGGAAEIREDLGLDYANPGFNVIPPSRYHAFICTGPRCATRGSFALYEHVREAVARRGLTGRSTAAPGSTSQGAPSEPTRVSVVRTGCLYPCNLGPMMVVYPDATWYCALTTTMVERIADQHFVAGRVVEAYTRRPGTERHTRPAPAAPGDIVEDVPEHTGRAGLEGATTG